MARLKLNGKFILLGLFLLTMTSGCAWLQTEAYQPLALDIPQQWQAETGSATAAEKTTVKFWESFQDPLLNRLIERVLQQNSDVRIAAIKLQRARLQAGIAEADRYPTPAAAADGSWQKPLDSGSSAKSYSLTAGLSYELDLWKKYSAAVDVAKLEAAATDADQRATMLSLVGTAADLYWQIGYLHQLIASNEASLGYAEESLLLAQTRFAAGQIARTELIGQQQELLQRQQTLAQNRQDLTEARNAFALLFDQAPGTVADEPSGIEAAVLPAISAGLPAELLQNRPDLQAAELRLRKAHQQIAVTKRSYYPQISLTGTLGASSDQLRNLLQNPVAALGAGIALPFLQWDLTTLNIRVAESEYAETVSSFRQALFSALSEVENALSAHALYTDQERRAEQNLDFSRQTEQLSEIRYRTGDVGRQDWLDAQEQRRVAQREQAEIRLRQLQNMMQLYQALGGGAEFGQQQAVNGDKKVPPSA